MKSHFFAGVACLILGGLEAVAAVEASFKLGVIPASLELQMPGEQQALLAVFERAGLPSGLADGVVFSSEDPKIAEVSKEGVITARANGSTRITAQSRQMRASATVTVRLNGEEAVWSFNRHVLPVMSKANCNGGGCHGALAGKGGFRLSLGAYDPAADFLSITRDALGRRIEPGDPLHSLLLTKPTSAAPHKGGRRLDPRSEDYRVIAEWIAAGAPGPQPQEAGLDHIEVLPARWSLQKGQKVRLLVRAHYGDGRVEDVTRWAKFASTDETMVRLSDPNGGLEVTGYGEGAVTAWFSSRIVMSRILSPFPNEGASGDETAWTVRNTVDATVNAQLRQLNLTPAQTADDATFLRRATLDATGSLPTPEQTRAFLDDKSAGKRDALIERLLGSKEFTDYWTYRWSDVFLISGTHLRPMAVKAYYQWLHSEVEKNTSWDQLVRHVVTAKGDSLEQGATNFFAVHQEPEAMAENVSQAFMGLSINCAKCHNHPLEKWTNDQYYAFANLFSRVRAKGWGGDARNGDGKRTLYTVPEGELLQPKTARPQPAAPLDAAPVSDSDGADRREVLADWLTSPANPYFTRVIVNRVWAAYFGIGIVNSVDDLRASNPATNEALMETLCAFLVEKGYDLKALMRLIMQSATYQRSSEATVGNKADSRYFARYYPRRLMAEVMSDAISAVTGVSDEFNQILLQDGSTEKTDLYAKGTRALQLNDAAVRSYFLKTFGRNQRQITCDCERSNQPSIVQALHLSNGDTLNGKLAAPEGNVTALLQSAPEDKDLIEHSFLLCLSRFPKPHELQKYSALLASVKPEERRQATEDLLWSLLSSREFLFQH